MTLTDQHRQMLIDGSGISEEVIAERGYSSVTATDVRHLTTSVGTKMFSDAQCLSGLLLPLHTTDGGNGLYILRPENPRVDKNGKALKYEIPKGQAVRLDCPPRCKPMLGDPNIQLWITEGQKKGDALATRGLCSIALLGVWNFKGKNDLGGKTFLADWDYVALNGRDVHIAFDSDVMTKPEVRAALNRLTEHLQRKGAHVNAVYLPTENGGKVGVDDYLLTHSVADLRGLVEAPRPTPTAAAPVYELLDDSPPSLNKPIQLIEGKGYAVTWLWTRTTRSETYDEKAKEVRYHNPPIVETTRKLFVVRDDGVVFGDGLSPTEELGVQVAIPYPPRDTKLWSSKGVKAYRAGGRPDPRNVFSRMVSLVDRYMSFDRSLAEQKTMCELVGCYALSTWFMDAFNVIGFLWPNGGYGTGKTKLGSLVCEMAYLGEVLLSGSTYACLRDLADLGATLLFDDVEALSDPKKTDPDKRSLLLAGNRRGATIAVKEPAADRTWKIRHVNAYSPKMFTAIRLPDPVLASRTIVIPLVRTADAKKANAEPLDYTQWPCDQRQLLDDLWALALANLSKMSAHEAVVNQDAPLVGRVLEPWKAVLAVAHWLDGEGEAGLYKRMCDLALSYQTERADLEAADLTRLVVKALVALLAPFAPFAPFAPLSKGGVALEIEVFEVVKKVNQLAVEEGLFEEEQGEAGTQATGKNEPTEKNDDPLGDLLSALVKKKKKEFTNEKQVGWVLTALRLKQLPKRSEQRRRRQITLNQLDGICKSYGLPPIIAPTTISDVGGAFQNGANGANGVNGVGSAPPTGDIEPDTDAWDANKKDMWRPLAALAVSRGDDAEALLTTAGALAWPRIQLDAGAAIAEGAEAWQKFAQWASTNDIEKAIAALVTLSQRGDE